jgi:hypothetical protein
MGCIKLHILDQQYKSTELKVSYINKKLTPNFCAENLYSGTLINYIDPDGNEPVPAASRGMIGNPFYYRWRYNDFMARNPNATAPSYYLDYGFKYAARFKYETNSKLSQRGQK